MGTLILLGCSDELEVAEVAAPIEEVQEELTIEEEVTTTEIEVEAEVTRGEVVAQRVSDAELEAAIRELARRNPNNLTNLHSEHNVQRIVDFALRKDTPSHLIDDVRMNFSSLTEIDRNHNNFELLKNIRDNQTNSTLINLYDDLINLVIMERNGEISLSEYIVLSRPMAETLRNSDVMAYDAFIFTNMHSVPFVFVPGDTMVTLNGNSYSLVQLYAGRTEDKKKAPVTHIHSQLMRRIRNGDSLNVPIYEKDLIESPYTD